VASSLYGPEGTPLHSIASKSPGVAAAWVGKVESDLSGNGKRRDLQCGLEEMTELGMMDSRDCYSFYRREGCFMDLGLRDRVILVTGGARGIGRGIAEVLATEGAIPVIVGRDAADNEAAVQALAARGGRAHAIQAELTSTDECRRAVAEALARCQRLDGLVNNAGENDGVGLETGDGDRFLLSLRRNLTHYYEMAHFALTELKKTHGAIVNISSKVAETGQGGTSAYAAANGGRNALTREWAVELAKYAIRVNAVIVAECWTPMYAQWIQQFPDPEATRRRIEAKIPLGQRMTTCEEIGSAVAFLLSPRSSHTTGQLLHVDGGYVHLDRAMT
jgi:L-fucose dehydrogenase